MSLTSHVHGPKPGREGAKADDGGGERRADCHNDRRLSDVIGSLACVQEGESVERGERKRGRRLNEAMQSKPSMST